MKGQQPRYIRKVSRILGAPCLLCAVNVDEVWRPFRRPIGDHFLDYQNSCQLLWFVRSEVQSYSQRTDFLEKDFEPTLGLSTQYLQYYLSFHENQWIDVLSSVRKLTLTSKMPIVLKSFVLIGGSSLRRATAPAEATMTWSASRWRDWYEKSSASGAARRRCETAPAEHAPTPPGPPAAPPRACPRAARPPSGRWVAADRSAGVSFVTSVRSHHPRLVSAWKGSSAPETTIRSHMASFGRRLFLLLRLVSSVTVWPPEPSRSPIYFVYFSLFFCLTKRLCVCMVRSVMFSSSTFPATYMAALVIPSWFAHAYTTRSSTLRVSQVQISPAASPVIYYITQYEELGFS